MTTVAHDNPLAASDHWPPTAEDAAREADWWTRYAIDRAGGDDGRTYHPGFRSHLEAARIQFVAVLDLGTPGNDQVRLPEAEWGKP